MFSYFLSLFFYKFPPLTSSLTLNLLFLAHSSVTPAVSTASAYLNDVFCLDMSPGTMTKYVSKATSGLFRKINGEVSKICFSALQCLLIRKFVHVFGREATSPSVCSSVLPKLWLADKEPIAPRITCLKNSVSDPSGSTAFCRIRIHFNPRSGSGSTSISFPEST